MMTTKFKSKNRKRLHRAACRACHERAGHGSNHRSEILGSAEHHPCRSKLSGPRWIVANGMVIAKNRGNASAEVPASLMLFRIGVRAEQPPVHRIRPTLCRMLPSLPAAQQVESRSTTGTAVPDGSVPLAEDRPPKHFSEWNLEGFCKNSPLHISNWCRRRLRKTCLHKGRIPGLAVVEKVVVIVERVFRRASPKIQRAEESLLELMRDSDPVHPLEWPTSWRRPTRHLHAQGIVGLLAADSALGLH